MAWLLKVVEVVVDVGLVELSAFLLEVYLYLSSTNKLNRDLHKYKTVIFIIILYVNFTER